MIASLALAAPATDLRAQSPSFKNSPAGLAEIKAGVPAGVSPAPEVSPPVRREWLILVFISGVNDLGLMGYADKSINSMENAGSSGKVTVLAEFGMLGSDPSTRNIRFQRGSKTLFIRKDTDPDAVTSPVIYASNDTDMGSVEHLVRFVKRGLRRFPAEKVAVMIWDHGYGRKGLAYDDLSGNHIEVGQLGLAMSRIKRELGRNIDIFAADACRMQMAEVAYELKDSVSVVVGSEGNIPADSYPYADILARLNADPGMPAEELGASIVDAYGSYYASDTISNITLSALRTSALPGFLDLLNGWVRTVVSDPEAFKAASSPATVDAARNFLADNSKDLYDYLSVVDGLLPGAPAAVPAGAALRDYISGRLIIRATDPPGTPRTHGLAVYIPDRIYNSGNYEQFAFARDSLWDDFLRRMMEERLK